MDGRRFTSKDIMQPVQGIQSSTRNFLFSQNMTVYQNIFMGHEKKKGFFLDDKGPFRGCEKILQRLEHEIPPETMVGESSCRTAADGGNCTKPEPG